MGSRGKERQPGKGERERGKGEGKEKGEMGNGRKTNGGSPESEFLLGVPAREGQRTLSSQERKDQPGGQDEERSGEVRRL